MRTDVALLVFWVGVQGALRADEPLVEVKVRVEGLRHHAGSLKVGLFGKDGFPRDEKRVLHGASEAVVGTNQTVSIKGIPPGRYAILVYHDENDNGVIDFDILGRPRERYGVSNNVRHRFRAPSYEEAEVTVGPGSLLFLVKLGY